jgi:hypothetical protein
MASMAVFLRFDYHIAMSPAHIVLLILAGSFRTGVGATFRPARICARKS